MGIFIQIMQLLLSLSILVVAHEMGHFGFARLFKTRVEKFYLFFDPWFSLFKFKKGDTEYGIGWLPLGGYVKISGMIDESMDKEQLAKEPEEWEFRSKKAWQRLLIMLGGVLVNFVLAGMIYTMILFTWGEKYIPIENVKYGILTDGLGEKLGFKNGDDVVSVNGVKIARFDDVFKEILLGEDRSVEVMRDGKLIKIPITGADVKQILKRKKTILQPRIPFLVKEVSKGGFASKAGVLAGDKLLEGNSSPIAYFDEYATFFKDNKGKEVDIKVLRNNQEVDLKVEVSDKGKIGVLVETDFDKFFDLVHLEYGLFESIPAGATRGVDEIGDYLKQFRVIADTETEAYKEVGGFIAITKIFGTEWNWERFWIMTAMLSIMLGVVNLLPIPALDGGHVMFLLYEIISGRKPGDKFMEYAQMVGMFLLLALLIYANGNDIVKLFD